LTTAPNPLPPTDLIRKLASDLPTPPRQMSMEHLFLRCTSTVEQRPHAMAWILERGRRAYPECAGRLEFTEHVRLLWNRTVNTPGFVRWVEQPRPGENNGVEKGFVLTGLGEARLAYRYQVEFVDPYHRHLVQEHGREIADQVRALLLG
jgi:hypothetical protein